MFHGYLQPLPKSVGKPVIFNENTTLFKGLAVAHPNSIWLNRCYHQKSVELHSFWKSIKDDHLFPFNVEFQENEP